MKAQSAFSEASERTLILSHGAKLADVQMLHDGCAAVGAKIPSTIRFGDTYNTIRDLHRRRPVTKDKQPPSWALGELGSWLGLDMAGRGLHRALPDAILTWDVLASTLDRYGDDNLTPRQQLVPRYYSADGDRSLATLATAAPTAIASKKSRAAQEAHIAATLSQAAADDAPIEDDDSDMMGGSGGDASESEEPEYA